MKNDLAAGRDELGMKDLATGRDDFGLIWLPWKMN
jgi:hypothetical protein